MSTNKFLGVLNGISRLYTAINTSSGASDADKIVATASSGRLGSSLMPTIIEAIANATLTGDGYLRRLSGAWSLATPSGGAFSQTFISSAQTITAGGLLTIAHGLSSTPTHAQIWLKCTTAELGYSVNHEILADYSSVASIANQGVGLRVDNTNIYARLGNGSGAFNVVRYDDGSAAIITNSSWQVIFKVWY